MTSVAAGLLLGLSLIVAIGAQNVFVLRQGLRREHVGLVAAICAVSDAVLIVLGVSGIGAATSAVPWLSGAVRWLVLPYWPATEYAPGCGHFVQLGTCCSVNMSPRPQRHGQPRRRRRRRGGRWR